MNKELRIKRIKELEEIGEKSVDEIIEIVVEESGKTKATVKSDYKETFPDKFPKSNTKEKSEEKEDSVLRFELSGNPEEDKGRVSEYEVPKGEEDFIHVELEKVFFDNKSGKKTSSPRIQKFEQRAWLSFKKNTLNIGFTHCRVLYAPEGVNTDTQKEK